MKEVEDIFSDFINNPEPQPDLDLGDGTAQNTVVPNNNTSSVDENFVKDDILDAGETTEAKPTAPASEDVQWDSFIDDIEPTVANETKSQTIDWSEIGKAIEINSEIKGPEDLKTYVSELRKTVDDLKTKVIGEDIPKPLLEAIEIARNNGDYRAYLDISEVDYKNEDPVELFEDEVAELFYNKDGSFREDEYNEYIDSIPAPDKMLRGRQIQRELILLQEQKLNQIKQKAAAERAESLRKLESSLNNFKGVDKFEATPKVKKQLFEEIATGKFMSELGLSENGAHNYEKLLTNYFKARYFDTIQKFNAQRAVTENKRAELKDLTNSTVGRTSRVENPVNTDKKSGIDLYLSQLK